MSQTFFGRARNRAAALSIAFSALFLSPALLGAQECPLTVADIEQAFGGGFKAEVPSKFGDVLSCRFAAKDYTVQVTVQPAYGMTLEAYNAMMSPKTVTWKPIPDDPDRAAIEVRDDSKDDLASTPAVAYVRADKYVRLQVLGTYYGFSKSDMPAKREEMRAKLAKVRRIP